MRIKIICWLLLCSVCFAGDWYVDDTNGSDDNNGVSWALAEKTIGAAFTDAANGDTIHIAEGTYDMGDEANNYLYVNGEKGVTFQGEKVSGGTTDRSATIIAGHADGGNYCVRVRDCHTYTITFKDLTITPDGVQNDWNIYLNCGADFAVDLVLDNVVLSTGSTGACLRCENNAFGRTNQTVIFKNNTALTITGSGYGVWLDSLERAAFADTTFNYVNGPAIYTADMVADMNVVDCTFNGTGTGGVHTSGLTVQSYTCKFTGNTITTTGTGIGIDEYVYYVLIESNTFSNTNNTTGQGCISLGTNDQTDTNPLGSTFILRNTMTYLGTDVGHVIALGGGTDYAEVAYNTINAAGDASETGMGIVIKGDGCNIHHNFIRCQRGIWIKGGQNTKVQYNSVYLDGTGLYAIGIEDEDSETAQYSVITNNIFDASNGTYCFYISGGGWDNGAAELHSQMKMDWNCYVAGSTALAYDGAANLADLAALQTKWASWSGLEFVNNDANSIEDDPEFMDASSADFRLKSTSPCINAGDATLGSGFSSMGAWQRKSYLFWW